MCALQPRRQRAQPGGEREEHAVGQATQVRRLNGLRGDVQHDEGIRPGSFEGMCGIGGDERGVVHIDAAAAAVHVHLQHAARGHHDLHKVMCVRRSGQAVGAEVQHDLSVQFDNPVDTIFRAHFPTGYFVPVAYSFIRFSTADQLRGEATSGANWRHRSDMPPTTDWRCATR